MASRPRQPSQHDESQHDESQHDESLPDFADAAAIPLAKGAETWVERDAEPWSGDDAFAPARGHDVPALIEDEGAAALQSLRPPPLRLAERLVRTGYGWRVPGDVLAAPFGRRLRPRVVATVENPLPGDRVAGTALRLGHFLVCGAKFPFAAADPARADLAEPLARVVHGFTWLADLEATAGGTEATAIAERLLTAWLDAHPSPPRHAGGRGPARLAGAAGAWTVERCGTRVLNWLVHAPVVLASLNPGLRTRAMGALLAQVAWLDRRAARASDPFGAVAGWCAIVAAGLLLPAGKPRRLYGERGLVRALRAMVSDDGGVLSRSPAAQADAIALLVRLAACYRAIRHEPPEAITTMLGLMVPPLMALRHGDGGIGGWQGGAQGTCARDAAGLDALIAASRVRARPLRSARGWGYQHLAARDSIVQFDTAPPPLPRDARHGCAATLAFEFSHAGHRLVVNCGGAAAAGALVPAAWEEGLRATLAHSTLTLDERNSTAILPGGAIGRGVAQVDVDRRVLPAEAHQPGTGAMRLEASHDGYAARYGLVHRRALTLADDGRSLAGEDRLEPVRRSAGRLFARRREAAMAVRFHLGPEVEAYLAEDGHGAGLALPDGSYWLFRAADGPVRIEESVWVDGGGRPLDTRQLVLQMPAGREGLTLGWSFRRLG